MTNENGVDLSAFLSALSSEKLSVKKIAAKAVLNYRNTRNPYEWNDNIKKIIALGISEQRLRNFFINI